MMPQATQRISPATAMAIFRAGDPSFSPNLIGAIKLGEKEGSPALNIAMAVAGLILCVAWGIMNYQGWDFSHALLEDARKAAEAVQLKVNPYKNFPTTFGAEVIFYCAMSVVVVFFVLYLWLIGQSVKRPGKAARA